MKRYIIFNDMNKKNKYIKLFINKVLNYECIYKNKKNITTDNNNIFLPLLYDIEKYKEDANIYILFNDQYKDRIYKEILAKATNKRIIYIDKINLKQTIKTIYKIKKNIKKRKIIFYYIYIKLLYLLSDIEIKKKDKEQVLLVGDIYNDIVFLNDDAISKLLVDKELVRIKYNKRLKKTFKLYNDDIIESILEEIPKYKEVIYIRHKTNSNYLIYDYLIDELIKDNNIKIKKIIFDNSITKDYLINCLLN